MARTDARSILKIALISGILLGIMLYAYFQARTIITGPKLNVFSPTNGETVASSSPEIIVRGNARNISFITINGLQIFTNEQGDFARTLLLANGYNIITIEARDKFNRSVSKELQLIVK